MVVKEDTRVTLLLPYTELAKMLKNLGIVDKTPSTLSAWSRDGMRGRDGKTYHLPFKIVSGVRHASCWMVQEFLEEIG